MKILFIDNCHHFLIQSLRNDGHDCIEGYDFTLSEILTIIEDVEGIIIRSRIRLTGNFLSKANKLLFIARAGAGMESIDIEYALNNNIACINSPEGNRNAVGEHALGMLLSLMNNLNRADRQVRKNEWVRESNRGHELQKKTVGIVGYGNMGSSFASKLRGFDCEILAYDKYKSGFGNNYIKESSLEEIMERTDVLSIHLPLTTETEFFINDASINNFRKNFYFINTARGKCVRTDDLVKNIQGGKILGACLDVIEYEDLSFEKISEENDFTKNSSWQYLIHSDKVILSPHIAGWSFESLEKIAKVLYEKIFAFIQSKK
jgi:D-3-phosphoglycerate dehydrogenase